MKKTYHLLVLLCLAALVLAISCASAPPPDEGTSRGDTAPVGGGSSTGTTTETTVSPDSLPPSQADLSALEAAAARAAEARELLSNFDAPALFPLEWEAADSLYTQAEEQKKTSTRGEVQESVARYNNAADAFDSLIDKIASLYYEEVQKELANAREAAINAGAQTLVPGLLSDADRAANEALEKFAAKDYYGARDGVESAWARYNQALAAAERQKALNLKANVAAKTEFDSAEAVYTRANAALNRQNYEEANGLFIQCSPMFAEASAAALEKQRLAEEALRRADQRVAQSDETARTAELILEGGMQ